MKNRIVVSGASLNGAFIEEASLAMRLAREPYESADPAHLTYLVERAARLRAEAEQVAAWMRATVGLVEPEPV